MKPVLIGYFARRPRPRGKDLRAAALPPQIEEFCNLGHMNDGGPPDWINLWQHNAMWLYSTEFMAWATAVDTENLRRIYHEAGRQWCDVPGRAQRIIDEYVVRHVPSPAASFSPTDPHFNWHLYAYRMFPIRFANGTEEPLEIAEDHFHPLQPLPKDYVSLGLDLVNRTTDTEFGCSPLNCNGHYQHVSVNRCCLLDQLETALDLGRHWSGGKYNEDNSYSGPAEPGPYFILEVLRKNLCPS